MTSATIVNSEPETEVVRLRHSQVRFGLDDDGGIHGRILDNAGDLWRNAMTTKMGTVRTLRRYAVKSMQGEDLDECSVIEGGLVGDRAYALIDKATGKVASAKFPQKWRKLIQFSAAFTETPTAGGTLPPLYIARPDGARVDTSSEKLDAELSAMLGREVTLTSVQPKTISVERLDPLATKETIVDIGDLMTTGRFADYADIHLITTASLKTLSEQSPNVRFDARRFRPNIVVETPDDLTGFVENTWVGQMIQIGEHVRLRITDPSPRCAIPTLAQGDLPQDQQVIRTIATHNKIPVPVFDGKELPCAGVYGFVERTGALKKGDAVRIV
jgi:uncharacterized protein YcbX